MAWNELSRHFQFTGFQTAQIMTTKGTEERTIIKAMLKYHSKPTQEMFLLCSIHEHFVPMFLYSVVR